MKYYGASPDTQMRVGKLLNLPLTGNDQDWEFTQARPRLIKTAIPLIQDDALEMPTRLAIACILVESLRDYFETHQLPHALHHDAFKAIRSDPGIHSAMHFFWLLSTSASNKTYLNALLSIDPPA